MNNKFTKHIKKTNNKHKNKTLKKIGGNNYDAINNNNKEGIIDTIKNKLSNNLSSVGNKLTDTGLKIIGLERINKNENNSNVSNTDSSVNMLSNVKNIADRTAGNIIENINEVLDSNMVKTTTKEAANKTLQITSNLLNTFNEAANNPQVKEEVTEAMKNVGIYSDILVVSMEEPFNKAVDIAAEAVPKATNAAVSGAIRVGTDAMAAIPGVGGIIEMGKIINDGSKAASSMFEAGTEIAEGMSDLFIETKANFQQKIKELEEKKKMAQQIANRTNQSIRHFENPMDQPASASVLKGGRGIKGRIYATTARKVRRLFGRKRKSSTKRVRFVV